MNWKPEIRLFIGPSQAKEHDFRNSSIRLVCRLDTNSGMTMVDRRCVEHFQITASERVELSNFGGSIVSAELVPMYVGLADANGRIHSALANCVVGDLGPLTKTPNINGIVGCDLLELLNARVELDASKKSQFISFADWQDFENDVAELYRALGGRVRQDVNLQGNQVDLIVEETTTSGHEVRIVVECKSYRNKIGISSIKRFAEVFRHLESTGAADRAVMVAARGFSKDAHLAASSQKIELLTISDLRHIVKNKLNCSTTSQTREYGGPRYKESQQSDIEATKIVSHVFIAMSFQPYYDDVYYLGIRETLEKLGLVCERVDEMEFNEGIRSKIIDSINRCDLMVAEMSEPNLNVYYEVGFGHAKAKPVILLTRSVKQIPFDLRDMNHIVYRNILDLRKKLHRRVTSLVIPQKADDQRSRKITQWKQQDQES